MLKNKIIRLLILSCLFTSLFTGCKNTETETNNPSTPSLTTKDFVYITLNSLSILGIIGLSISGYFLLYKPQKKINQDLTTQGNKLNEWEKSKKKRNPDLDDYKKINPDLDDQRKKISQLEEDKKILKKQVMDLNNKIYQLFNLIQSEYSNIGLRLDKLEGSHKSLVPTSPYYPNYNLQDNYSQSNIMSSSQTQNYQDDFSNINQNEEEIIETENIRIAQEYNQNPRSFFDNHQNIRVNLTDETASKIFQQYFTGDIEFKEDKRQGQYLIIATDFNESYLFLFNDLVINDTKLRTIKNGRLFNIIGELVNPIKAENIIINRPAKVEKNGEYWRLIESGEIDLRYTE